MTKLQREKHIANLIDVITSAGAKLDRWGFYRLNEWKIDTRKVNLKVYTPSKVKLISKPMVDVTPEQLNVYINKRILKK